MSFKSFKELYENSKEVKLKYTYDDNETYFYVSDYNVFSIFEVEDGDTIKFKSFNNSTEVNLHVLSGEQTPILEESLRFAYINCEELGQPFGEEAKNYVFKKIEESENITIKLTDKDVYGRFVAEIYIGENSSNIKKSINYLLVEEGLAYKTNVFKYKNMFEIFYAAEKKAKEYKLNIHSYFGINPSNFGKILKLNEINPHFDLNEEQEKILKQINNTSTGSDSWVDFFDITIKEKIFSSVKIEKPVNNIPILRSSGTLKSDEDYNYIKKIVIKFTTGVNENSLNNLVRVFALYQITGVLPIKSLTILNKISSESEITTSLKNIDKTPYLFTVLESFNIKSIAESTNNFNVEMILIPYENSLLFSKEKEVVELLNAENFVSFKNKVFNYIDKNLSIKNTGLSLDFYTNETGSFYNLKTQQEYSKKHIGITIEQSKILEVEIRNMNNIVTLPLSGYRDRSIIQHLGCNVKTIGLKVLLKDDNYEDVKLLSAINQLTKIKQSVVTTTKVNYGFFNAFNVSNFDLNNVNILEDNELNVSIAYFLFTANNFSSEKEVAEETEILNTSKKDNYFFSLFFEYLKNVDIKDFKKLLLAISDKNVSDSFSTSERIHKEEQKLKKLLGSDLIDSYINQNIVRLISANTLTKIYYDFFSTSTGLIDSSNLNDFYGYNNIFVFIYCITYKIKKQNFKINNYLTFYEEHKEDLYNIINLAISSMSVNTAKSNEDLLFHDFYSFLIYKFFANLHKLFFGELKNTSDFDVITKKITNSFINLIENENIIEDFLNLEEEYLYETASIFTNKTERKEKLNNIIYKMKLKLSNIINSDGILNENFNIALKAIYTLIQKSAIYSTGLDEDCVKKTVASMVVFMINLEDSANFFGYSFKQFAIMFSQPIIASLINTEEIPLKLKEVFGEELLIEIKAAFSKTNKENGNFPDLTNYGDITDENFSIGPYIDALSKAGQKTKLDNLESFFKENINSFDSKNADDFRELILSSLSNLESFSYINDLEVAKNFTILSEQKTEQEEATKELTNLNKSILNIKNLMLESCSSILPYAKLKILRNSYGTLSYLGESVGTTRIFEINKIVDVKVSKIGKTREETCIITIPNNTSIKNEEVFYKFSNSNNLSSSEMNEIIQNGQNLEEYNFIPKEGDNVSLDLGVLNKINYRFNGKIVNINFMKNVVVIFCSSYLEELKNEIFDVNRRNTNYTFFNKIRPIRALKDWYRESVNKANLIDKARTEFYGFYNENRIPIRFNKIKPNLWENIEFEKIKKDEFTIEKIDSNNGKQSEDVEFDNASNYNILLEAIFKNLTSLEGLSKTFFEDLLYSKNNTMIEKKYTFNVSTAGKIYNAITSIVADESLYDGNFNINRIVENINNIDRDLMFYKSVCKEKLTETNKEKYYNDKVFLKYKKLTNPEETFYLPIIYGRSSYIVSSTCSWQNEDAKFDLDTDKYGHFRYERNKVTVLDVLHDIENRAADVYFDILPYGNYSTLFLGRKGYVKNSFIDEKENIFSNAIKNTTNTYFFKLIKQDSLGIQDYINLGNIILQNGSTEEYGDLITVTDTIKTELKKTAKEKTDGVFLIVSGYNLIKNNIEIKTTNFNTLEIDYDAGMVATAAGIIDRFNNNLIIKAFSGLNESTMRKRKIPTKDCPEIYHPKQAAEFGTQQLKKEYENYYSGYIVVSLTGNETLSYNSEIYLCDTENQIYGSLIVEDFDIIFNSTGYYAIIKPKMKVETSQAGLDIENLGWISSLYNFALHSKEYANLGDTRVSSEYKNIFENLIKGSIPPFLFESKYYFKEGGEEKTIKQLNGLNLPLKVYPITKGNEILLPDVKLYGLKDLRESGFLLNIGLALKNFFVGISNSAANFFNNDHLTNSATDWLNYVINNGFSSWLDGTFLTGNIDEKALMEQASSLSIFKNKHTYSSTYNYYRDSLEKIMTSTFDIAKNNVIYENTDLRKNEYLYNILFLELEVEATYVEFFKTLINPTKILLKTYDSIIFIFKYKTEFETYSEHETNDLYDMTKNFKKNKNKLIINKSIYDTENIFSFTFRKNLKVILEKDFITIVEISQPKERFNISVKENEIKVNYDKKYSILNTKVTINNILGDLLTEKELINTLSNAPTTNKTLSYVSSKFILDYNGGNKLLTQDDNYIYSSAKILTSNKDSYSDDFKSFMLVNNTEDYKYFNCYNLDFSKDKELYKKIGLRCYPISLTINFNAIDKY